MHRQGVARIRSVGRELISIERISDRDQTAGSGDSGGPILSFQDGRYGVAGICSLGSIGSGTVEYAKVSINLDRIATAIEEWTGEPYVPGDVPGADPGDCTTCPHPHRR